MMKTVRTVAVWAGVRQAYDIVGADTLSRIYASKKRILQAIIDNDGGNDFKIPHSAPKTQ